MFGLVEADLAATGEPHLCNRTPSLFLNFRALNALFFEGTHLDLQIVTHEIEFVGTTLSSDGWTAASAGGRAKISQP